MTRCMYCVRRIWPWQRQGRYTGLLQVWRWHAGCRESRFDSGWRDRQPVDPV